MAEWAFLWLQKQHLHGIDRAETVRYLLEGAAARGEATQKVGVIDLALSKVRVELGEAPAGPQPTPGLMNSLPRAKREHHELQVVKLMRQTSDEVAKDMRRAAMLQKQLARLEEARACSQEQVVLMNEVYDMDKEMDSQLAESGRAQVQLDCTHTHEHACFFLEAARVHTRFTCSARGCGFDPF